MRHFRKRNSGERKPAKYIRKQGAYGAEHVDEAIGAREHRTSQTARSFLARAADSEGFELPGDPRGRKRSRYEIAERILLGRHLLGWTHGPDTVMAGGESKTLKNDSTSLTVRVRGVLVDMDGVLISSIDADERSWLRWARIHGIERGFPLKATHGRRAIDTILALCPELDPIEEARRLEDLDEQEREGTVVMPGAQNLLSSLPSAAWTIVSSASERLMRGRLGFAGIPIPPRVISAESVTRGKPDPEPYLAGAALLGIPTSECLVIEDAPSGIEAGRAAGCKVLAVLSSHEVKDLSGADWIVPSLLHVTATPIPGRNIQFRLEAPH